jgi:hypothetical protein
LLYFGPDALLGKGGLANQQGQPNLQENGQQGAHQKAPKSAMDAEANIEADNHNAQQVVIMTRFRVLRLNVRFGSHADVPTSPCPRQLYHRKRTLSSPSRRSATGHELTQTYGL